MEQIRWRSEHLRPRPVVPYLCEHTPNIICDRVENLRAWPVLMQWDQNQEVSIITSATRCQAWLYFGVLQILTVMNGGCFRANDFVATVGSRKVVNSAGVQLLIQEVSGKIFAPRPKKKKDHAHIRNGQRLCDELQALLPDAVKWITQVVQKDEESKGACNLWNSEMYNVFLSTLLLIEGFCDVAIDKCTSQAVDALRLRKTWCRLFAYSTRTLRESFKDLGHCASLFAGVNLSLSTACQSLALPPETTFDHSECRSESCRSYNVNHESYVPQHTKECDRCSLLRIDTDVLCRLVGTDSIPLVRSILASNGEINIDIVDGTDIHDYVAISHLWAGGLGNMEENAHYQCQLKQIHVDLASLHRSTLSYSSAATPVYYWLDSLCIPVSIQTLKVRAINSMARIYAGSKTILVIDPTLYRFSTNDMSLQELDIAVLCSAWMARSWTLQEGALAVNVVFRFADRLVPFKQLKIMGGHTQNSSIQSLWLRDVDRIIPRAYYDLLIDPLFGFGSTFGISFHRRNKKENMDSVTTETNYGSYLKFVRVWNELSRRTTSESADIAAIFGTLIDRSASEVLNLREHARMQALLRTQTMLPTSLLFAPVDSKSATWSPSPPGGGQQRYTLQFPDDVMEFLPSGTFRLNCLRSVHAFRLHSLCSLPAKVCIDIPASILSCRVQFEDCTHSILEASTQDFVLLFDKQLYSNPRYKIGKCFVLIRATEDGWHLKYARSFTYEYFNRKTEHHHAEIDSPSPVSDFSEIDHVSPTCPLFLDMLVEWPQLHWSRSKFYPFTDGSRQVASWLHLFDGVFLGATFITYTVTISQFFSAINMSGYPSMPLMIPIAAFVYLVSRNWFSNIEYIYFQKLTNRDLQPRWAASFSVQKDASKSDSEPPRYLRTAIFYTILLVATYIPTVLMFVRLPAVQTMWDKGLQWPTVLALFQQVVLDVKSIETLHPWHVFIIRHACRTTFIELLIRGIVMSTVDLKKFFHIPTIVHGYEVVPGERTDERFLARLGVWNLLYYFVYVPGLVVFIALAWMNAIVSGIFNPDNWSWMKLFVICSLIYSTVITYRLIILVYGPKILKCIASAKGYLDTVGSQLASGFSGRRYHRIDGETELIMVQQTGQTID